MVAAGWPRHGQRAGRMRWEGCRLLMAAAEHCARCSCAGGGAGGRLERQRMQAAGGGGAGGRLWCAAD
ncbi:hypothetical protein C2E21_8373 [Chlorella sorokiniana]|uniref:Uncharacterized protein n=1 Tax=Chlorella sorokiniana TaxID=3076 RepID=A0A2P6TF45_CHLSO|nr:hypothetical protein C2E21_8373 [Chlorella sorokiniana]|eukprot:PRW32588.1 hypothetical protein C2E21_8373 [Chlorella sorokiniana]